MKTIEMKKVMIAVDLDPTAQKVAEIGYSLAKTMGAEIILLHIIVDGMYYSKGNFPIMGYTGFIISPLLHSTDTEDAKAESQNYLLKIKDHLGDNAIRTVVKEGDAADMIVKAANELKADVVVMGSHSRRWLEEILVGSVTEKVLHHSTVPLFIVPTQHPK